MLCSQCYHDIPPGSASCPHCGAPTPAGPGEGPGAGERPEAAPGAGSGAGPEVTPEEEAGRGKSCPWEERERIGAFNALGETLQRSLFHPSDFFGRMPPAGRAGSALLYAVVIGTIAAAVAMMWQKVFAEPIMWGDVEWNEMTWHLPPLTGYVWYAGLALLPLVIISAVMVRSLVLHLSLMILGGARSGYEATLKVAAYAMSASTFNVFPLCGPPIAFVWRIVLTVIGLREAHRISTGRAFVAWLLPFLIVSCLLGAALTAVILVLMKAIPGLMGDFLEV